MVALALPQRTRKGQVRIFIRNCYAGPSRNGVRKMVVENMREWRDRRNLAKGLGAPWPMLQKRGFTIRKGPFLVKEFTPNFVLECSEEEFRLAWATRQYADHALPTGTDAHHPEVIERTPTFRLIEMHWKQARLDEVWRPSRVLRLCRLLGLTPAELAEFIQFPQAAMERVVKSADGDEGIRLPGPVAVWFHFLENSRLGIEALPDLSGAAERKSA